LDDQGLKRRILELLSSQEATKEQIKNALFIQSDKTLNLLLKELQVESLIYRRGAIYSVTKTETKPTKKRLRQKHNRFSKEIILQIMFALIGTFTTIVGIRNTVVFTATVFPAPFCFIMSGAIALFIIGAIPAIIYLWNNARKPFACVLAPIWLIVTMFSMFCTVEGMYSIQKDNFIESTVATNVNTSNQALIDEYDRQIKSHQKLIEDKTKTLDRYNKDMLQYDTAEKIQADLKNYNRLAGNISAVEKYIKDQTEAQKVPSAERVKLLSVKGAEVVVVKSFYEKVEESSGVKAFLLQFIVSCFAAIILDILGPISLSIALYLKKE
jgi:hypothetical protein